MARMTSSNESKLLKLIYSESSNDSDERKNAVHLPIKIRLGANEFHLQFLRHIL